MLKAPGDLVFVIDALDEHPRPRGQLLRFLADLLRNHTHNIRLLAVSRDEPDIRDAMEGIGAAEVDLNRELKQKEDICTYVTGVLQEDEPFRRWKIDHPRIVDVIKDRLLEESM
jgi:hypothetical protein